VKVNRSSHDFLLSTNDAARLAGLKVRTICHNCLNEKYPGATKGADGWIIPLESLPAIAQTRYNEEQSHAQPLAQLAGLPAGITETSPSLIDRDALFQVLRRAPPGSQSRAKNMCAAVVEFEEYRAAGTTRGEAAAYIESKHGIDAVTLWRYREAVKGHPRELWEAVLLPRYKGRTKEADLTPDAWNWICSRWLSTSEPPAHVVIKEARKEGASRGWVLPSDKTIIRKLNALPAPIVLLGRKGKEALDATFPAAERDFAAYGLHDVWVSDGRRADVFCRWPDGTVSRPFIVAWCEMRTRMILGVRGGFNATQNLVLASFHTAAVRIKIKPQRALLDNGREYAAKAVTGGQKTRYRFKVKEGDPIGALTRMGVTVDWARPYRGQEKPIESFWKYMANHLDKLPEFQGAYCGKDTVSKPVDLDRNKAIPIEIYGAKLAEVFEEFNHRPHRGRGMDSKSPAQLYEELMQADPRREWPRITTEDLRILCLEQRMLTLNNKDASIRLAIPGYGEARYWSETLVDLPIAARSKKYAVFCNPEDPDIPVVVYDGERLIGEASRIGLVGDKQAAAQHCINKAAFKKPRAEAFKEIRQAAPLPIQSVVIEKPAIPTTPPIESKLKELSPGVYYDPETGETIGKGKPTKMSNEPSAEEIEEFKRRKEQRDAERLAKRFGTA
jgi:putative transposase